MMGRVYWRLLRPFLPPYPPMDLATTMKTGSKIRRANEETGGMAEQLRDNQSTIDGRYKFEPMG